MSKTYIIAEAGVNHNGSLDLAIALIDAAMEAGADAVKFQTFKADKIVTATTAKARYQKSNTGLNESQLTMLKALQLNEEAHDRIVEYCRVKSIDFISTPFDTDSVKLLTAKYKVKRIKIASGEITNAPLLLEAARTQKPIILSTGMCLLGEIEAALGVVAYGYLNSELTNTSPSLEAFQQAYISGEGQRLLKERVTLLHCTTEYPAPFKDINLRMMDTLSSAFQLPVGYSDHSEGIAISIAAAARGASMIEKHFTLDRSLPGPDHKSSLEPIELKEMVRMIRQVEASLGSYVKMPAPSERTNMDAVRKSIVAATSIPKGEKFTEHNMTVKRPGTGISPMYYYDLMNQRARIDYETDDTIQQ
ncbi:N-acetylneuraminate synthase [Paenibacillus rigui]|uniref:N-acetylneuraminate synthase n=1 Tax=Paenibacillus rigui TaxID=554312 RepID=A0A229UI52_9BACL|nr:N-acetylneuraminate synthase [Paenibacillus rigui]OXM83053.1 N-acetylneuraminate synthase [Paenibacillus rigui]